MSLRPSNALFVVAPGTGSPPRIGPVGPSDLPDGELDVAVLYSSLNYKDALAVTGKAPIVRAPFPFVPGIDLAGRVTASRDPAFREGDRVLQTGWGLGEDRWGGYSGIQRIRAGHAVRLPDGLTPFEAMALGTAGFTAMLACSQVQGTEGPIVVTGASGGVGSIAVMLLARLGREVVASTGKQEAHGLLRDLGAGTIIGRGDLGNGPARPLDSARWGGAVDCVGGPTLAAILSQTARHGTVAACGLAHDAALHTTVYPFILRGVRLVGIDSNTCPTPERVRAWDRLAELVDRTLLRRLTTVVSLAEVPGAARRLLGQGVTGRIVVDLEGAD